jgi:sensor domain CHASE-containing protein
MARLKIVVIALIAVLIISLGFNFYQLSTNQAATKDNQSAAAKQEMLSQLMHTQNNVNTKLAELEATMKTTCQKLSSVGLTGPQADRILSEAAASDPLIMNSAATDINDILVNVKPDTYGVTGDDITMQEQQLMMRETMQPVMSNVIMLVQGYPGVVLVAPIFNSQDQFMGALSLVIQPSALINQSIASTGATTYAMWAMQSNGTLLYDPDPTQQGKNLLTDPIYADYPELQSFTRQVAAQQSGYGTYQYYVKNIDQTQNQVVSKEAYWITVGIYGTEWRLVVWNPLS